MTIPSPHQLHQYAYHPYDPSSSKIYHHHQKNDSSETVFATPLLGTPPPMAHLSPSSPSSIVLPPISPPTSEPKKLKTIAELNSVKGEHERWRPGMALPPIETLREREVVDDRGRRLLPPPTSHPSLTHHHWRPSPNIAAQMELRGPPDEDDAHFNEHRVRPGHSPSSTRPTTSLSASTSLTSLPSLSPRTPYASNSDLGRTWWSSVVAVAGNTPSTSATPLPRHSPAIAVSPPEEDSKRYMGHDEEEVDELSSERSFSVDSRAQSAVPPSSSNPFDYHNHGHSHPSFPPRDVSGYHLTPPSTADAALYQLRPLTTTTGPRRASTYSPAIRPQQHLPQYSPSAFSTTSLPTPRAQMQPIPPSSDLPFSGSATPLRGTKKRNVPLYNRSKPSGGTFYCGYLPPRSTDPMAADPSNPEPCQTTACKKADMDRHFDEIHAKDEAGRVFRRELDVECAARYLVDLANMVLKEMKSEGSAQTAVKLASGATKVVDNTELWIQADRVRVRVGKELAAADAPAKMTNYRFDFTANGCVDFRDLAQSRAQYHRAYPCMGCVKTFGSQRSLERHYNTTVCGQSRPNKKIGGGAASGAAGKKRKQHSGDDEASSSPGAGPSNLLASPFIEHRFEGGRPVTTAPSYAPPSVHSDSPPAAKRPRISSPLKSSALPLPHHHQPSASSVMMRVRQQTPETRRPEYYHDAAAAHPHHPSVLDEKDALVAREMVRLARSPPQAGSRSQPIKLEEPEFEEYRP
ncbi:hypothetical protein FRC04_007513 [Tulasnella sp. 424]|nr:hypothetical protein FRC04_007513 [Tulasnella sp. 424]